MELSIVKEVIKTLMESKFYFALSLKERLHLVKYVVMVYAAKSC